MSSLTISMVIVPGVVALLLFLVFTYLYEQSRRAYFLAWELGWAAYTLHYALNAWAAIRGPSAVLSVAASLLQVAMALAIFVSTRLMRGKLRLRWYDLALAVAGVVAVFWNHGPQFARGWLNSALLPHSHLRLEVGLAAVLLYCSASFYVYGQRKNSGSFSLLAISLALWAVLMTFGQFRSPFVEIFGTAGSLLGPVPQMLLGIAMVMVLFENERNAVQDNALAFSTLGVDARRLLTAEDLGPSMQNVLDRLIAPLPTGRALICISERWRTILPSVHRGYSADFVKRMETTGAGEYLCELTYRRGGFVSF